MPPPKFAPIKKRKSKRTIDFGLSRSAPTTPVGKPPAAAAIPEVNEERGSDSDSEFGFGNSWSNAWLTFCSLFFSSLFHCLLNLNLPFQKCHFLKCPFRFYVCAFKLPNFFFKSFFYNNQKYATIYRFGDFLSSWWNGGLFILSPKQEHNSPRMLLLEQNLEKQILLVRPSNHLPNFFL